MSDVVIRAEELGKKYLIGHQAERERYMTLRDVIGGTAKGLLRSATDMIRGRQLVTGDHVEEIWALKDVSFEIRRGEVVGIIGRNGAGKSTLLKILARITEPSVGRVEIRGRVASLLEVGTGFHPELTGRENIYLNGAILGMTRAEIRRKFDEIVDFAGVKKFLDTPVKRYSTGMSVRLAFAVAAHLEPEILVVDEVLAVGDAEFQRKCLGKMGEVAAGGRTVLFVSHNMGAVRQLCNRGMTLISGAIAFDGRVDPAISAYLSEADSARGYQTEKKWTEADAPGSPELRLTRVVVTGETSQGLTFRTNENITVTLQYTQTVPLRGLRFVVQVLTVNGEIAFATTDQSVRDASYPPGNYETRCVIPAKLLNRTGYTLMAYAGIPRQVKFLPLTEVARFFVDGVGNEGATHGRRNWPGVVCPEIGWRVLSLDSETAN